MRRLARPLAGSLFTLLFIFAGVLLFVRLGYARRGIESRFYLPEIRAAAAAEGVDPLLLCAMVRVESGFRPQAVSARGARGLLQVMPGTAREVAGHASELHEPAENLRIGARYLRVMQEKFGDTRLALAAYNGGPASVEAFLADGGGPGELDRFPKGETRRYVEKVMRNHDRAGRYGAPLLAFLRKVEE